MAGPLAKAGFVSSPDWADLKAAGVYLATGEGSRRVERDQLVADDVVSSRQRRRDGEGVGLVGDEAVGRPCAIGALLLKRLVTGERAKGGADGWWKTCALVMDHEPHVRPRVGRAGAGALAGR